MSKETDIKENKPVDIAKKALGLLVLVGPVMAGAYVVNSMFLKDKDGNEDTPTQESSSSSESSSESASPEENSAISGDIVINAESSAASAGAEFEIIDEIGRASCRERV